MWGVYRVAADAGPDFASSISELTQATFRRLVYVTAVAYLVWHLVATLAIAGEVGPRIWLVTPLVGLLVGLTLWLAPRRLPLAQMLWLFGLAAAIALSAYVLQQPGIALLYGLLPLVAVVTAGLPIAVVTELAVIGLAWWLAQGGSIPAWLGLGISIGGGLGGLLGWAATDAFTTLAQWSFASYREARQRADEALDQRLRLKQTEADLLQANRELAGLSERLDAMRVLADQARQAKEEFVANVSHELRTPLNMIIGFSTMITQSPRIYGEQLPPALLADIASIKRNSEHLAKLVDDVLDLSQVEAGRLALSKEQVAIGEIIGEATEIVRSLFDSKRLYLTVELTPDVGEVFCDRTRIRQVIINLLSNAGRFTEEGGVRIRAERQTHEIVVSVEDTGPGIPPEQQTRIFEPFHQADGSIRRRYGGSGLGLSISKRFVEMHEGRMWLESSGQAGEGTTIYFTLPTTVLPTSTTAQDNWSRWFSAEFEFKARTETSKAPPPDPITRYVVMEQGRILQRLLRRYAGDAEVVAVGDLKIALQSLLARPPWHWLPTCRPPTKTGRWWINWMICRTAHRRSSVPCPIAMTRRDDSEWLTTSSSP